MIVMTTSDGERQAFYEQVRIANAGNPDPVIQALLDHGALLDQVHESYAAHQRGERGIPLKQIQVEVAQRRERERA